MAKTRAIFGSNTKVVDEWSKTTAHALGISRSEALKSANQFGQMFKVMGVGRGEAVKMSKSLTELTAKLALFAGKSPEEAAQALAGAMAGRTRALKTFGIVIDQTTIKAEAMRLGLIKSSVSSRAVEEAQTRLAIATAKAGEAHKKYGENTTQAASADLAVEKAHDALSKATAGVSGAISQAAKAQAIYSLVQGQSKSASEAWRREQGSAEVQLKKLHAEIHDTEVTIGNALLPTVLKITTKMADWLGKTENQKKIQHDLNVVVKDAGIAVDALKDAVKFTSPFVKGLNSALGGTKHSFELLFALGIAAKIRSWGVALGFVGRQAAVAKGEAAVGGGGLMGVYAAAVLLGALEEIKIDIKVRTFIEDHTGGKFGQILGAAWKFGVSPAAWWNRDKAVFNFGKDLITGGSGGNLTGPKGGAQTGGSGHGHNAPGHTGPITPGMAAVERYSGGRVIDDYATSGHAPNSYHYRGQAADLAPDPAVWARLYANRGKFAELFGPWGLFHYGVRFYDSVLQKQHMNHIHVAYTGGPQAISRMMTGGGGAGLAGGGGGTGGTGGLVVGTGSTKGTWKGATEATIVAAKATVTAAIADARKVIGGMAGPMDEIERAALAHMQKLKEHLHPHMTATDLARTKADIAKWGKVLRDEISEQTKRAKRAFDQAAREMLRAFDAETAAGLKARAAPEETPTEALLREMQQARDDAQRQQALADAIASGDAQAIADAQYEIQVAALQKQADAERKAADEKAAKDQEAYQTQRDDQRQALQDQLDDWNKWLSKKMKTWNQFWAWVKANPNGGGVIPNIGETKTAPNFGGGGGGTGGWTQVGGGNGGWTVVQPPGKLPAGHGIQEFAFGGIVRGPIGSPQLAVVHGGETVVPAGGSSGGLNVTVNVHGALLGSSVPEVTNTIYRELLRKMKSNGTLGFR